MNLYYSVSESYDLQRKQMHEYKNQIECIDALLKRNRYEELRGYVQRIRGNLGKNRYYSNESCNCRCDIKYEISRNAFT